MAQDLLFKRTHAKRSFTIPTTPSDNTTLPPVTINSLNAKDRAELVKRTRKLEKVLGVTMHIIDHNSVKPLPSKPKSKPPPLVSTFNSNGVLISTSTSVFADSIEEVDEDAQSIDNLLSPRMSLVVSPASTRSPTYPQQLRSKKSLVFSQSKAGSNGAPVLCLQPISPMSIDYHGASGGRRRSGSVASVASSSDSIDTTQPLKLTTRKTRRPFSLPASPSSPSKFEEQFELDKHQKQRQVFTASKLRLTLGENVPVGLVLNNTSAPANDAPRSASSKRAYLRSFSSWTSIGKSSSKSVRGSSPQPPPGTPRKISEPLPSSFVVLSGSNGEQLLSDKRTVALRPNQHETPTFKFEDTEEELEGSDKTDSKRTAKMTQKFGSPPPQALYQITNTAANNINKDDRLDAPPPSPVLSQIDPSPSSTSTSFHFTIPSSSSRRNSECSPFAASPPMEFAFPPPSPTFPSRRRKMGYSLAGSMFFAQEYAEYVSEIGPSHSSEGSRQFGSWNGPSSPGLGPEMIDNNVPVGPVGRRSTVGRSSFEKDIASKRKARHFSDSSDETVIGDEETAPPLTPVAKHHQRKKSSSLNELDAQKSASLASVTSSSDKISNPTSNIPLSPSPDASDNSTPLSASPDALLADAKNEDEDEDDSIMGEAMTLQRSASLKSKRASKISRFFGVDSPAELDSLMSSIATSSSPRPPMPSLPQSPSLNAPVIPNPRVLRKKSFSRKSDRETVISIKEIEGASGHERKASLGGAISRPSLALVRQFTNTAVGRKSEDSNTSSKDFVIVSGARVSEGDGTGYGGNGDGYEDDRRWSAKDPKEVERLMTKLREMRMK